MQARISELLGVNGGLIEELEVKNEEVRKVERDHK